ncbi:MAG: S-layer homology domain-containing protein, partial [Bacillota bacterium]
MMKRYLPIALVAMLVMTLTVPTAASPFGDVPQSHWAYEAVKQLAAYGIIEGFPDGTFKGAEPLTRYQMAMVIARLLVSLDAQIKAEIEAAKAGFTPPPAPSPAPAPAPVEKVIEKETVTVEKPIIEKVIETTIVEKLKTEELDALAARLATVEGALDVVAGKVDAVAGKVGAVDDKVGAVDSKVDAVAGRVDDVDKKADEINARVIELDGALALLEGELSVRSLDLETKIAAGDADLADKIAAIKAELEAKLADSNSALNAKIEAKAKELITLIDALKVEFHLELTALGVRVVALEEQLALANAKIEDLDARIGALDAKLGAKVGELDKKIGAVDEKAAGIGSKLDSHIAGHEKVTISGSSEVVLSDVDIYAPWNLTWDGTTWTGSKAWKDPNDIYDTGVHSDGAYYPSSVFEHKLDLTLTARPADGVVVSIGVSTLKNLYARNVADTAAFNLSKLSLEVTTPGMLTRLFAGDAVLPAGTFTPYTLTADKLKNADGTPAYEGVVGQLAFGKYSGTILFLRPTDDVVANPPTAADYICAGEGKVSLTDNLKLGVAYVSWYDDPQSAGIDDPAIPNGSEFVNVETDSVIGVYGSLSLAPGWSVSGEFAKTTEYLDSNVVAAETGTAMKLDVTGKVSALEVAGNVTRVEDTFKPDLVNLDPDGDGVSINNVKSVSISGKLPVGNLTLKAGYKVTGDADATTPDWDTKRTNITTASAEYKMAMGGMEVTPTADVKNSLYVKTVAAQPYADNTNVFELTGGVGAKLGPVTASYKATQATIREGAAAAKPYYTKGVFGIGLDYAVTPNLKLTSGYDWTKV